MSTSYTRVTSSPNAPSSPVQAVIYSVNPSESFASGGRRFYIYGAGFNSANNCKMILYNYYSTDIINETMCNIVNDSMITCISPSVKRVLESIFANSWPHSPSTSSDLFDVNSNSLTVRVSFLLDSSVLLKLHSNSNTMRRTNVPNTASSSSGSSGNNELTSFITSLHQSSRTGTPHSLTNGATQVNNNNLQGSPASTSAGTNGIFYFTYFPDPRVFFVFTSNEEEETSIKTFNQGESIVIDGDNLRLAATEADVIVTVGDYLCNVTSFTMKQIICTPPDADLIETNSLPPVFVKFGENISYKIGYLRYPHHKFVNTFASTSSSSGLNPHLIGNSDSFAGITSTWLFVAIAVFLGVLVVLVLVGWTSIKHGLFSRGNTSIGGNNRRHIGYTSHNINLRRTFGHAIPSSNGYHSTATNYSTNRHYFGTGMRVPPSSIGVFDQGYYDISSSMSKVAPPPPLISSTLKPLPLIPSSILFSNSQGNHGSNVTGVSLDRMTTNTCTSLSSASTSASNESTSSSGSNFLESSTKLTDLDGQNGNNFIVSSPSDSAANAIYAEIPEMIDTRSSINRHSGNNLLLNSQSSSSTQGRNIPNLLIPLNDCNGNNSHPMNNIGPETPLLTLNHPSPVNHFINNHSHMNHFSNGHSNGNVGATHSFNSAFHASHSNGHTISSCLASGNNSNSSNNTVAPASSSGASSSSSGSNIRTSYSPFIHKHQRIQPISNAVTVKTNASSGKSNNRHASTANGSPAVTSTNSCSASSSVAYNTGHHYEDAFLQNTNGNRSRIVQSRPPNGISVNNNGNNDHSPESNGKASSSLLVLDPTAWNY